KANARQRAAAQPQMILWLVARECLGKDKDREPLRAAAEKLGERALAAAKRQQDNLYAAAILREWGQLDLDRGDKAKAESPGAEPLAMLMPKRSARPVTPTSSQPAPPAAVPVPAAPVKPPTSRNEGRTDTFFVSANGQGVKVPAAPATAPATPGRGAVPVLSS